MGLKITLLKNYDNEFVHLKAGTVGVENPNGLFRFTDIGSKEFCMSYMIGREDVFKIQKIPTTTVTLKLEFENEQISPITPDFINKCLTSRFFTEALNKLNVTILSTTTE